MTVGVRSYGNSLLMQNIYNPDNLPDTIPDIKNFGRKILNPLFKCVEENCGTTIGRRVNIPEVDVIGLIDLITDQPFSEERVIELLREGVYYVRLRDTSTCVSEGGFCARCGTGFNAREGTQEVFNIGESYNLSTPPRAYQNYIAETYSGSLMGFEPLTSEPLPAPVRNWSEITSHKEMDKLCAQLATLKPDRDELEYIYTIEDLLERALIIIGEYGIYGNVSR